MPQYGFFLSRVMQPVSPTQGESGYFSAPTKTLDPHLFAGDALRPEIRTWILNTLYDYWRTRFHNPERWSRVWLAGSGISYQWSAARGNGDLDVLIGVDFDEFFAANPGYQGLSQDDVADIFNKNFHAELWPKTADTEFKDPTGGLKQSYEVTFYVNPHATDIRDIKPYAAYDVTSGSWTVRPPVGDAFQHPENYYTAARAEAQQASDLLHTHNALTEALSNATPGSPTWHNLMQQSELITSQASTLYDSIHLGRKQAFAPGGSGFGDWYNFRWQYHKQQGTAQALHAVAEAHSRARNEYNQAVYGNALEGSDVVLRRAVPHTRGLA